MLCLAIVLGWFLYNASEDATGLLARNALVSLTTRVNQETEWQLKSAEQALNVLAPEFDGAVTGAGAASLPFPKTATQLEERLWLATYVIPDDYGNVYFGAADGSFMGIKQINRTHFRLNKRDLRTGKLRIFLSKGPGTPTVLSGMDNFDPRTRPWYLNAMQKEKALWSPIYTDFRSKSLAITFSKPVYEEGRFIGVAGSSINLTQVDQKLKLLPINKSGVVFIMEPSGVLIAASSGEAASLNEQEHLERLPADSSSNPAIRTVSAVVLQAAHASSKDEALTAIREVSVDHAKWAVAVNRLHDQHGLEWLVVAAVPRLDFLGSVTGSVLPALIFGLLSVILTFFLGFLILRWVLRDIRKLTLAAKSIGNGEPFPLLNIDRRDEIGQLAQSFKDMEHNLRTDRLTSVLNRDSLAAQIDFRRRSASAVNPLQFALLFIDLDKFKEINDRYGHDEGDRVLVETAANLQRAVRKEDAVARFGGDEFVIYLHGVQSEAIAASIVSKIHGFLAQPITGRECVLYQVDASIGAALFPQDGLDIETLLRVADERMFAVKRSKK
ncbi:diguanylate cyclase [Herbaspirillum sp. RTI4]|nr:diguanylate cyclase [Herbaspirillum sp. RTI4]